MLSSFKSSWESFSLFSRFNLLLWFNPSLALKINFWISCSYFLESKIFNNFLFFFLLSCSNSQSESESLLLTTRFLFLIPGFFNGLTISLFWLLIFCILSIVCEFSFLLDDILLFNTIFCNSLLNVITSLCRDSYFLCYIAGIE